MASLLPSSALLLFLLFLFANALPSSGGGIVSKKTRVEEILDPEENPVIMAYAKFSLDSVNAARQQRWQKLQKRSGTTTDPPLPTLKFESLADAQMTFTVPGDLPSFEFVIVCDLGVLVVPVVIKSGEPTLGTWLFYPSNSK